MSTWRAMRVRICGSVWSIALRVTLPTIVGSTSICSLASRASANRSSGAGTRLTPPLYRSRGRGGPRAGCLGRGRGAVVVANADPHRVAPARRHRDQVDVVELHQVARASEKPLHPRRIGVVGDEKLIGEALVGCALEQFARRRDA